MNKKVDFDEFTSNYNSLLHESTRFFSSSEAYFAKYKIDLVARNIRHPVRRILEYGCGIGRNIRFLQTAFPDAEIVGTDISDGSLQTARIENPDVQFHLESEEIALGKFDLIFVAGVFHHIPPEQRSEACTRLAERLAPQGTLCIFEHNPYNPITRNIVNNCPYDADAKLLKPRELGRLLTESKFLPGRANYCLFIPPRLAFMSKLEEYMTWIPLGGQYMIKATHTQ